MSDDAALAEGGVSIVDTFSAGSALIQEGAAALAKATLETLKHQVDSSTADLSTLEKANQMIGSQYSEAKDNLADLETFYAAYSAHVTALKPHLDAIDGLEKVVEQLEESARTLDGQTKVLESAIAEVLQ